MYNTELQRLLVGPFIAQAIMFFIVSYAGKGLRTAGISKGLEYFIK